MFFRNSIPTDQEIILGILSGGSQRRQFENHLYQKFFKLISDATYKHKLTIEEASSVYSDSIIAVIDAIVQHKFQEKAQLKTFVYQIFNNKCVDQLRKNTTNKESVHKGFSIDEYTLNLPDSAQQILQKLCDQVAYDKLHKELAKIGEKCKQMLMAWADGYTDIEIAKMLAYNTAQVAKTSRQRCLEKLKENYLL
jgi:RNA polymerase sigma factor (sigma-70 family)